MMMLLLSGDKLSKVFNIKDFCIFIIYMAMKWPLPSILGAVFGDPNMARDPMQLEEGTACHRWYLGWLLMNKVFLVVFVFLPVISLSSS